MEALEEEETVDDTLLETSPQSTQATLPAANPGESEFFRRCSWVA
jgi:hypothetical protein